MRRLVLPLLLATIATAPTTAAVAQGPPGADTLSAAAVAESLSVLQRLDARVRADKQDAAAWHHRGLVAWALALRADAKPPIRGLDVRRHERMADTSLQIAARLEPGNPRYRVWVGRFLLASSSTRTRAGANAHFEAALKAARAGNDPQVIAETAVESGLTHWRRYESMANRRLVIGQIAYKSIESAIPRAYGDISASVTLTDAAIAALHNQLIDSTQALPRDFGDSEYAQAESMFREAYDADPANTRAFRHLAMALAERGRWAELRAVARDRTARAPGDSWGWLALGLAAHRLGESAVSGAAFDTALTRLDRREELRLFGLHRVIKPSDTLAYVRASADARTANDAAYWQMADPLWAQPGNDARAEFYSRVVFAELRWTVEDRGVRGADSDRGAIYIRYGPPDSVGTLSPSQAQLSGLNQEARGTRNPGMRGGLPTLAEQVDELTTTETVTFWSWENGMFALFWGMPTYGTARVPPGDRVFVEYLEERTPASWDNVAVGRVEPMPVRLARFRGERDSVDLYVATQAPLNTIRESAGRNATIRADFWLLARELPDALHDAGEWTASGLKTWRAHVAPATYMYRIEATADGALTAARATAWVVAAPDAASGFTLRGFGLSDLLLASSVESRVPTGARWDEIEFTPLLADVRRGAQFGMVWENYELSERSGAAHYEVSITVLRERAGAGRVAAEVIGALADAVGIERRDDRVVLRYERTTPHAEAIGEHVTISLGDTPAGRYRVTVQIFDRVTGRTAARTTDLTIRN